MYSKVVHQHASGAQREGSNIQVQTQNTKALNLPEEENRKHPQHAYQSYRDILYIKLASSWYLH